MPVQYVTFSLEVTARVDADGHLTDYGVDRSPVWTEYEITEVSGIEIEGFSIDNLPKDVQDLIEEMAAETALAKGEWHD